MISLLNLIGIIILFIVMIVIAVILRLGLPLLAACIIISKESEDGYGPEEIDMDALTTKMLEFERDMNRLEMYAMYPSI